MAAHFAGREIGVHWPQRFVERHPELTVVFLCTLNNLRGRSNDPAKIIDFFIKFREIRRRYSISDSRIYNMDKKRFLPGYVLNKRIIVPTEYRTNKFTLQDGSRDSITMLECVSASGTVLPPMLIFADKAHLLDWHRSYIPRPG